MTKLVAIIGIVLAGLGALGLRVVREGRGALAEGDAALAAHQTLDAIAAWETAARWYLPGAPHVDEAYGRLVAIADKEPRHALAAWRAVRRAALATRSLWTPHEGELLAANAAIARLAAPHPDHARAGGADVATREAWLAAQLAGDPRPRTAAALVAILGILCWLAGIGVLVGRGFHAAGRAARGPLLVGAVLTVGGLVGWAAGLYNA